MPNSQLQSFAKQSGKSLSDIERYWKDAKESIANGRSEDDLKDKDWAMIVATVKKRAGINESFLESKLNAKDYITIYT